MKPVNELTGRELDFWVAMAEGEKPYYDSKTEAPHAFERGDHIGWLKHGKFGDAKEVPKYSSQWAAGGPLIERENIGISPPTSRVHRNGGPNGGWGASGVWMATTWHAGANGKRAVAWDEASALVAAMRCFVRSKLGDEVATKEA